MSYLFFLIPLPPLFFYNFAFIGGILFQSFGLNVSVFCIFLMVPVFALQKIQYLELKKTFFFFSVLLMIPLGAWRYSQQAIKHDAFFSYAKNKMFTVIGRVDHIDETKNKQYAVGITTQSLTDEKTEDTNNWKKNILIYTRYYPKKLQVGDSILVANIIFKKPKNTSFNAYLIKQGIAATVFIPALRYTLIYRPNISFFRDLHNKRKQFYFAIKRKCSPQTFALFSSLFLGNRTELKKSTSELEQSFKQWGLMHILARSGLHLVMFILLFQWLLRFLPISFYIKQMVLIIIASIYFLFSWTSISFIRAFVLFLVYKLTLFCTLPFHFFHALNLICLIFLFINPIQLFFLDFQLTFILTATLSWFSSIEHRKKLNY